MKNQKIKVLWSMICNSTSTDQQTNTISLFGVIEEITITPPNEATPKEAFKSGILAKLPFEIVVLFSRDGDNAEEELNSEFWLSLVDPFGKSIMENSFPAKIEKDKKRLRMNIRMDGIKITMEGNYAFRIYTKNEGTKEEELASIPFDVKINKKN